MQIQRVVSQINIGMETGAAVDEKDFDDGRASEFDEGANYY